MKKKTTKQKTTRKPRRLTAPECLSHRVVFVCFFRFFSTPKGRMQKVTKTNRQKRKPRRPTGPECLWHRVVFFVFFWCLWFSTPPREGCIELSLTICFFLASQCICQNIECVKTNAKKRTLTVPSSAKKMHRGSQKRFPAFEGLSKSHCITIWGCLPQPQPRDVVFPQLFPGIGEHVAQQLHHRLATGFCCGELVYWPIGTSLLLGIDWIDSSVNDLFLDVQADVINNQLCN